MEQKEPDAARGCGSTDDLLLLGYLKTSADTSPFVTGNQNLIQEGAALDVINKRGTGADKSSPPPQHTHTHTELCGCSQTFNQIPCLISLFNCFFFPVNINVLTN